MVYRWTGVTEQRFTDGRITSWATEAEVIAAADIYRMTINITTEFQSKPKWTSHKPDRDKDQGIIYQVYIILKDNDNDKE